MLRVWTNEVQEKFDGNSPVGNCYGYSLFEFSVAHFSRSSLNSAETLMSSINRTRRQASTEVIHAKSGPRRDRTDDPRIKSPLLYRLS